MGELRWLKKFKNIQFYFPFSGIVLGACLKASREEKWTSRSKKYIFKQKKIKIFTMLYF